MSKRIKGIKWVDRVCNEEVLSKINVIKPFWIQLHIERESGLDTLLAEKEY